MGYAKLFSSIIHSTIWREEPHTKILWVTMLAMADKYGHVLASAPGLADAARISLDQCLHALDILQAPDPYSRTQDFEGKRVLSVDGGWVLLNYSKYRNLKSEDEVREKTRVRVANWRKEQAKAVTDIVTNCNDYNTLSRDVTPGNTIAEAEAEAVQPNPPNPPIGGSEKKTWRTKSSILHEYSQETKDTVNAIINLWPDTDESNRILKTSLAPLASRIDEALSTPGVTPDVLIEGAKLYIKDKPKFMKNPHTFFGKPEDNGNGANWKDYARTAYHFLHTKTEEHEISVS